MDQRLGAWILKVLVGSRAHGLHHEHSDYDYRGVFVEPTDAFFRLDGKPQQTSWVEGRQVEQAGTKADDTAWEVGHFLHLASKCNPTILEVFWAPPKDHEPADEALRDLRRVIWEPKQLTAACLGYAHNQRKKLFESERADPSRGPKFATAYLRTLIQCHDLMVHGAMPISFIAHPMQNALLATRAGALTHGQVIDLCLQWEERLRVAEQSSTQQQDLGPVNDYLIDLRKRSWDPAGRASEKTERADGEAGGGR